MANETFHWTVLDNAMQVEVKHVSHQRTINLGLFIRHGSQDETLTNSGISHYIEHVVFNPAHMKGRARDLIEFLMDSGANYEAYTSKEYIRCSITCMPNLLEQALECLGLLITNANGVTDEAIEHERAVILHEHEMTFSPPAIVQQALENALWGNNSLGLYVIGKRDNILKFQKSDLVQEIETSFVPNRTRLIAIGPIEIEGFVEMVERRFGAWKNPLLHYEEPTVSLEPRFLALPAGGDRVELLIAYPAASLHSKKRYPAELLADILGGGLKSRLFVELRTKRELAYLVHAYPTSYALGGYIAIRVNCKRQDVGTAYEVILRELNRLKSEEVAKAELDRVKSTRCTAVYQILQNSNDYLRLLGRRSISDSIFFVDIEINNILSVRAADIMEAAQQIFVENNTAAVGWGMHDTEMLELIQ